MAATAQAQVEVTKAAQKAGIAYAKAAEGAKAYKGRKPSFTRGQVTQVTDMHRCWRIGDCCGRTAEPAGCLQGP